LTPLSTTSIYCHINYTTRDIYAVSAISTFTTTDSYSYVLNVSTLLLYNPSKTTSFVNAAVNEAL